jgi:hypothetical protein
MEKQYVWKCNGYCGVTLTLNKNATAEDFAKFGKCRCGGTMEWQYNYKWEKIILETKDSV